jgi:hypothetical protein
VRRAASEQRGVGRDYALAVLGYLGDANDALSLEHAATRLSGTARATAQRSTRMIRQFAAYRPEAASPGTGVALNVLGPNPTSSPE